MIAPPFVAYFRSSRNAHDIEADLAMQRGDVEAWLKLRGGNLIAEVVDPPTGSKRLLELQRALAATKDAKATLVLARSTALARNTGALTLMMQSGIEVAALDNAAIQRRALPMLLALAEGERQAASNATRAALARAKAEGRVLGGQGAILARANQAAALGRVQPLAGKLGALIGEGLTVRAMAARLNALDIRSPGGHRWHPSNLHRALSRLAPDRYGGGQGNAARRNAVYLSRRPAFGVDEIS